MSLDAGRVGVRADQVDVHGRVTSPSFLNELLEDLPEWTDMPVWVNGTEEVLPSNTSVPVTSPILADIAYPDIRRDNQYFTYRESPTTVDGLAKIKSIKGNTLVWNQIQPNTISRTHAGVTYTYDNGKLTVSGTATSTSWWLYGGLPEMNMKANHKYLFVFGEGMADSSINTFHWYLPNSNYRFYTDGIITINSDTEQYVQLQVSAGYTIDTVFYPQVFDLTLMFGSGNEPTSVEEFRNLFPLDYYPYNSGSLLSFNGNGIKTVGKNQLNLGDSKSATANGVTASYDASTQKVTLSGTNTKTDSAYILINFTPSAIPKFKIGETYVVSASSQIPENTYFNLVYRDTNNALQGLSLTQIETRRAWRFTVPSNYSTFNSFQIGILKEARQLNEEFGIQLEFGSTATSYEPYTSSLLNLPISTYFPTGMKSAGNVYDELTPTKAITRIGKVTVDGTNTDLGAVALTNVMRISIPFTTIAKYNYNQISNNLPHLVSYTSDTEHFYISDTYMQLFIYKSKCGSTLDSVKQYLSSNPTIIYYELATPVELPTLSLGE